ncbi:MAG: PDZ domain-containing protein [Desulfamplus sp.]|nr:PDZ domain-containing protein [Desulfamplus sp.]
MPWITINRRQQSIKARGKSQGGQLKVIVFVALLLLLIAWSIWGSDIEKKIYGAQPNTGKIGAEILLNYSGTTSDLVIGHVLPNSPAARAGLKSGDKILGLDGKIISSPEIATTILSSKKTGDTLNITVLRDNQNKEIHVYLSPLALRDKALKSKSSSTGIHILAMFIFLKIAALMFFIIYRNIEIRMQAVLFFAFVIVVIGSFMGIYSPVDAFFSIKFNTISLLLGMYIISTILDQAGFFDYVAYRIYRFAGSDRTKIMILFCIITYIFSLLVNNLTTIMVIVPMTLSLADRIGFDPRPIVIGEVISSNIGGASTMVGDFPNMLIASGAGIGFNQFIVFMMPMCMILFGIMLLYLKARLDYFGDIEEEDDGRDDKFYGQRLERERFIQPKFTIKERRTIKRALFILIHMLVLFSLSDLLSLNPSAIALAGGLSIFLFSGMNKSLLLRQIYFNDVFFFTGLFIIVGGLEASGLLQYITDFIMTISMGKPWLCCMVVMWVAAFFTAFLSAGPTTALFFPIVAGIGAMPSHNIIWWSLSLGVLAGSSATVIGATAGPVATTLVENFSSKYPLVMKSGIGVKGVIDMKDSIKTNIGKRFSFRQFSGLGIPIAFVFLIVSNIYIMLLNMAY